MSSLNNVSFRATSSDESSSDSSLGCLLFAFNNEEVDYLTIAKECARRVIKYWNVPVSIVTDIKEDEKSIFDRWIMVEPPKSSNSKVYYEYDKNLTFLNTNRCQSLELTPYDRTIVIDTDLLVSTDSIPRAWTGRDIAIPLAAYSIERKHEGRILPRDMRVISDATQMIMAWATVLCFDRNSALTKEFFRLWSSVISGYEAYSRIYGFPPRPMRNDFAVTVAMHRLTGMVNNHRLILPYSIPTLLPGFSVTDLDPVKVSTKEQQEIDIVSDLHVMNKKSILSCIHTRNQKLKSLEEY